MRTALVISVAFSGVLHATRVFETANSDDAFILFRYARNLIEGRGLVWNVGESPVEGFTSLLHVLLVATGGLAGADLVVMGQAIGIVSMGLACVAAAWLASEVSNGDRRIVVLAPLFVAASPAAAAWARGGMETLSFTALVACSLAGWLRERRKVGTGRIVSSLAFAFATLSRPEALGLAGLSIGWDVISPTAMPLRRRLREGLRSWWPYVAFLAAYGSWKLWYFGDLLPTTWHAKSGGGVAAVAVGAVYVAKFLRGCGMVTVVCAILMIVLPRRNGAGGGAYLFCAALVLAAPTVAVGGDYQYFWRYLVPVVPIMAVLAIQGGCETLDRFVGLASWRRFAVAGVLLAGAGIPWVLPSLQEVADRPWLLTRPLRLIDENRMAQDDFVQMGRALDRVIPPGESLATVAVGAIGYYCDRPIVDMLGLNDREIACAPVDRRRFDRWRPGHMRGDARIILKREPDYIIPIMRPTAAREGPVEGGGGYRYPFLRDLLESSEFRNDYRHEPVRMDDGRWIQLYRRRP